MPTLLQIGIWNVRCDVGTDHSMLTMRNMVGQLAHHDRYRLLKDVVATAVGLMPAPPLGTQVLRMFLAPEYLFARSHDRHVVHPDTHTHVLADLAKLSTRHPTVLFFPGTVAYCKPMIGGGKNRTAKYANVVHANPHAPQHLVVAHNTAYVFHNGAKVFKYRKMEDAAEVNPNESLGGRMVFVPGPGPGVFTSPAPALQIGIEVCADHAAGHLSHGHQALDVHVILSASTGFVAGHAAVREGGVVCHADATGAPAVYQKVHGQMVPVATLGGAVQAVDPTTNAKIAASVGRLQGEFAQEVGRVYASPVQRQNTINNYTASCGGRLGVFEATI